METEISSPSVAAAPTDRNRGMTPVSFTLAAGVPARFGIAGDWFHTLDCNLSDAFVRFDDGEKVPAREGVGYRRYYGRISLESVTGGDITVLVGYGSVTDARSTANVDVTTNVAPGNTFDSGADVAVPDSVATKIRNANADTLYVSVTNPSDSAGPVRIGAAGVDLTKGQLVESGVTVPIACTADLYAYHENGTAVTLSVAAVKQV